MDTYEGDVGFDPQKLLKTALDSIPQVVAETLSTKVFSTKWQAIRTKLEELGTTLATVADCPHWAENSLMKELLPRVVSSLDEIRDLARSCTALNFSGKLLMQSDLDVVVSKLNLHLRDSDLLLKSGVLGAEFDGAGDGEEVLLVKDVFARLQIGNTEQKDKALSALIKLLEQDGQSVMSAAKEKDIGYLVHLLDSNVAVLREQSTVAVSILARSDSCKACSLLGEGSVVAPLVRVLESGSSLAKEKAAEALHALTVDNSENSWAVCANGGVSDLVNVCHSADTELRATGVRILSNLWAVEEIRIEIIGEGAIPVLVSLLNSGAPPVQESAARCIDLMASDDEKVRQIIESKGGFESLFRLLERAESLQAREIALRAIHNLSTSPSAERIVMDSPKFLKLLVQTLDSGYSALQNLAAAVICNLSGSNETNRVLGKAGCIPLLARMLDGKAGSSQEIAARALSSLFLLRSNRKEFIKDEVGVSCLVGLLNPENETVAKKFPLLAVEALSNSDSGKIKIVHAGGCQHLEKLAEMEVVGAKKILNKIAGNSKLLKIFSGKWLN
ncbi:vacuolar protein 8 [Cryptomeria japonica]|uniref:vacuolar protein 8 n=1 Tax=Cryptomeria japonica TaxID=3369 RepID=UPI0027D9EC69|nr:vacuolar protein 8 [Cryptomeria japonica]